MKPYGSKRRDNLICKYGCCHGFFYKAPKKKRIHRKKRARQLAFKFIKKHLT